MEDLYPGMLYDDPYSKYNYNGSQVYVPAAFPSWRVKYCSMQTDKIHIRIQTTRVSRAHVQVTSWLIKLKASKLKIQEQTRAEEVKVFISVWLTLVVNKYFAVSQCAHAWQILSRFLEGSNKFCQSSESEPLLHEIFATRLFRNFAKILTFESL